MKKSKIYLLLSLFILVISISALGGYFYGKISAQKRAELDKEAAVKGALYDAQERISKEALGKAQEVLDNDKNKENTDAAKVVKEFYSLINERKFDEAWNLFSSDLKSKYFSSSKLKTEFANIDEVKVKELEFRTSGETSYLYSVTTTKENKNGTIKEESFFIRVHLDTLKEKWLIDQIDLKEKDTVKTIDTWR